LILAAETPCPPLCIELPETPKHIEHAIKTTKIRNFILYLLNISYILPVF